MKRPKVLEVAIKAADGVSALARRLGISRQAVSKWRKVPKRRLQAVAGATGIPAARLRPDLDL